MAHDTFISYSSKDKNVADAVCAALESSGVRCWIAPRDIRPGDNWGGAIVNAIGESRAMVIVFSANSNTSQQVMREVERAVQKNVVVVPFRIDDVKPSADMEYFLSATHWLDALSAPMEKSLQELAQTVSGIISGESSEASASPQSAPVSSAVVAPRKDGGMRGKILIGLGVLAIVAAAIIFRPPPPHHAAKGSQQHPPAHPPPPPHADRRPAPPKSKPEAQPGVDVQAPKSTKVGADVKVVWKGPEGKGDYLAIAKPDAENNKYITYKNITYGSPLKIRAPVHPGQYELRYVVYKTTEVLARVPITVEDVAASIDAPREAMAASEIKVSWQGPNNKSDYIAVSYADAEDNEYQKSEFTSKGNPLKLQLPEVAGDFEIRYVITGNRRVLARSSLTLTEPQASVSAQRKIAAGRNVNVEWSGPKGRGDFLTIVPEGAEEKKWGVSKFVKRARGPISIKAPKDPGEYEIRYVTGAGRKTLASAALTVK